MDVENLRDEIKAIDASSKEQTIKYESIESWSFAYLSRWTVLERGLKELYNYHNKDKIRSLALEWVEYIEGRSAKRPQTITDFSVQTQSIPKIAFIKKWIGNCSKIEVVLDSGKRYRRRRNRIAHKAEEFSTKKTYSNYKTAIDEAIKQLITKLSQKVNANKKKI